MTHTDLRGKYLDAEKVANFFENILQEIKVLEGTHHRRGNFADETYYQRLYGDTRGMRDRVLGTVTTPVKQGE